jgi:hypothetical protein
MYRSSANRLFASIVSVALLMLLVSSGALLAAQQPTPGAKVVKPTTVQASRVGVSPPMRTMKTVQPGDTNGGQNLRAILNPRLPNRGTPNAPVGHDPLVQRAIGKAAIPSPLLSFDGISDVNGVQPADTTMDVSPSQVLQWVNLSWSVYDKSGNQLGGPFLGTSFWSGLGGVCANNNGGDILVRWDQFAGQWWVSQLAYPGGAEGFHQCIAVSTSSDALGTYYQYDFLYSPTDLNDYPKLGMWPVPGATAGINDGYYVSVNNFANASTFTGTKIMAFDRQAQLAGNPGVMQIFDVGQINPGLGIMLPADLRGTTLPPNGSMQTYVSQGAPDLDGSAGPVVHVFQSYTDFTTPANSFLQQLPDLPVDPFDWASINGDVAPQVGGGGLEVLNDRPMYRADYRVFADHDALVFLHDVNVGPSTPVSGERWYELRGVAGATLIAPPTVFQSGTYGPDDSTWRWMGSIAQDTVGNISMGFSATSGGSGIVSDPSVHYTGRLSGDPLGTMTQGEDTYLDSTQPFSGFRWGDYSTVVVDPVDQCTFWYTTMYGAGDWATRVGNFKFPNCSNGPSGTLEGHVTDGTNPIAGVTVVAGANSTSTDASGHYLFLVPVGTYSMTASKFGFLPASASGVVVTDGGDTVQDFTLTPAPSVVVNGIVTDGSGGAWPLYAKIVVTAPGAPTSTLYTDPVTGYYSLTLVQGITWSFAVSAPGYVPGGGSLPLVPTMPVVANWVLLVDAVACTAPGYAANGNVALNESFDAGTLPPNWTVVNNTGNGAGWYINTGASPCGDVSGNLTGGTGPYALVDSDCDGLVADDNSLISPSLDLSTYSTVQLKFNEDYNWLGDEADVDVSPDGGTTWTNVLAQTASARGPLQKVIDITSVAAGHSNVQVRFHNYNVFFAWWWQVDNVIVSDVPSCTPEAGGLVVGNVRDANTGAGLNGATVTNVGGGSTTSFATPNDPNEDDGLYILFAFSGQQTFQASHTSYSTQQKNTLVVPNSAQRLDFSLGAGELTASPSPLNARLDPGTSTNQTLTLTNNGSASANFTILEINAPLATSVTHGFAPQALRQQAIDRLPKASNGKPIEGAPSTKDIADVPNPPGPGRPLTAGNVLASYPSGITLGWGIATSGVDFWLSSLGIGGGDNKDHEYDSTNGTSTGATIDDTPGIQAWAGDGAYDVRTGMMWRVDVVNSGSSCIFELDPVSKVVTGNRICPSTGTSERGLAYDAAGDTFFMGSWNDLTIWHFDTAGNILDSAVVNLPISGLAYNPANGHLLVMSNSGGNIPDITVLDAHNNYAVIGSYAITNNGTEAFTPFGGAGLEFDCQGNLWAIDQNTQTIYNVESDEGYFCALDIPWLSENPTSGTVSGGGGTFPVTVTFDSTGLLPGLRQAQLQFQTDTPYAVPGIPVNLTVLFLDVPDANQFQAFIYGAAGAGIMMGGPPNCPAGVLDFCPNNVVTRADMAGYIFRAVHGANTAPPVYLNEYGDVTFNDYNAFYIQGITNDGITAGCGNGNYCPNSPNTRAQMSVFIWKGQHGSTLPPACVPPGSFSDVPCGSFAADYIYGLFSEGVTAGCGGGNFCPNANITNGQMAVFLVKGFNIPHL